MGENLRLVHENILLESIRETDRLRGELDALKKRWPKDAGMKQVHEITQICLEHRGMWEVSEEIAQRLRKYLNEEIEDKGLNAETKFTVSFQKVK